MTQNIKVRVKNRKGRLIISLLIVFILGVITSYKYFATREDIMTYNIEVHEDYSVPDFKTVVEEIFN